VLKKKIYPLKFVLSATNHLPGEKNGKRIGWRLNIVAIDVAKINNNANKYF